MRIDEILRGAAERFADRPAVIDAHGAMDYRSLWRRIDGLRERLVAGGPRAGLSVGVLAPEGREFIIAALAAVGAGATVLPLWTGLTVEQLAETLQSAAPHAVLGSPDCLRELRAGAGGTDLRLGACRSTPSVCVFEAEKRGGRRFAGLKNAETRESGECSDRFLEPIDGEFALSWTGRPAAEPFSTLGPDIAFVRFTSGTTGASKGVALTHEAIIARIDAANQGLALSEPDVVLWPLPMAFHFFVSILLYLRVGATIVVCDGGSAASIIEAANRHDATFLYASPDQYRALAADRSDHSMSSLRRAVSTATGLGPQTARDFESRFGLPITQAYGIIEVGLPLINLDRPAERPESVGRPLPGYEIALLDDEGRAVAPGQTGELAIRGPGMFAGYLNPPMPASALLRDGFFPTGDLAQQDPEGRVTILGRAQSVITVGGRPVFPEEIETVLDSHPRVAKSRVTARPDPSLGQVPRAEVALEAVKRLNTDSDVDEADSIVAWCRERLPERKVPRVITFVDHIEETPSGKVKRP